MTHLHLNNSGLSTFTQVLPVLFTQNSLSELQDISSHSTYYSKPTQMPPMGGILGNSRKQASLTPHYTPHHMGALAGFAHLYLLGRPIHPIHLHQGQHRGLRPKHRPGLRVFPVHTELEFLSVSGVTKTAAHNDASTLILETQQSCAGNLTHDRG